MRIVSSFLMIFFVCFFESGKAQSDTLDKYILTPPPSLKPHINGAAVFGARPGSPILYKVAASGQKPIHYSVKWLPAGLSLNANTGIISGVLNKKGSYKMELTVTNSLGKNSRLFTLKIGNQLGLTPPMGWNSWNCWGLSVNEDKVKESAQALIDKGLVGHGWAYINIDDGWEAANRNADGTISPNKKFPDIKSLSDWLHTQGLKFGIYSSPGTRTCGGFLGSYRHELQDAATYANWGVDYLKYDWCSYDSVYRAEGDTSLAAFKKPYEVMHNALKQQNRDIYYSLCQYGWRDVWKWGAQVDGNSWRTTGDIEDNWESLRAIWSRQAPLYPYAGPGHWNDPDMLIVGKVGWGDQLHQTGLTANEQYTHISLWCLLSAPLLIGCDISKMDKFTVSLLTNDEVLALDQDIAGNQAQQKINGKDYQVWVKELSDGNHAIGIFNLSDNKKEISINWNDLGLSKTQHVRDLWRQKDLGKFKNKFDVNVAPHGVSLIKVF